MVKNKSKLAIKLFIVVWIVLAIHIVLKLTFNYWQPYIIPNEQLQVISDFIDDNRWIQATLNGILYVFNGTIVILCSIKRWWFKSLKQSLIVIGLVILGFVYHLIFNDSIINTLILSIVLPLILDRKKWYYIIITFIFSNLFMILSLWLEGFVNTDDMQYVCKVFLQFDYYIMLVLSYFVINLITFKKKVK